VINSSINLASLARHCLFNLQLDVAEDLDVDNDYEGEGEEDDDVNVQIARRSLASIFGESEVVEVDETQKDESLLVSLPICLYRTDVVAVSAITAC